MVSESFSWSCRRHRHYRLFVAVVLLSCLAAPAVAADRHAGYYYPEPATSETYKARTLTLGEATREKRIGFIVTLTNQMLGRPYPPEFAVFVKGAEAEKMIIVALHDDYLDTLYRARALFALLTSVARSSRFITEHGLQDFVTFFDLAKLLGFSQITISDGDAFAHQVIIE